MANYVGPYNMLVPTGVLQNSSDVFNILDPDSGGSKTFSVKLSANGQEPPTYYGCRTMLEEATENALLNMNTTEFKAYVNELSVIRGRTPVGSVTAFKNSVLMNKTQSFWTYIASQGLQLIQPPPI